MTVRTLLHSPSIKASSSLLMLTVMLPGLSLLSGCGGEKPTPPPQAAPAIPPAVSMEKPAAEKPAAKKDDHDHDHGHDHEMPKTIEEAIASLKQIGVKVEKELTGGSAEKADDLVHSVGHLIEDLHDRGLDKDCAVIVWGEFGRTPTISARVGRDHWPRAFSNIWFGGGIDHGKVVGASDKKGEDAISRRFMPQDFIATIYQHLGIDYHKVLIEDFNGRPTALVDTGRAIPELTA